MARTRRIISADRPAHRDWSSELVWTNLYKVSPAAGWNPGAALQHAQRRNAIALLDRELEELAPKRVLALTGSWLNPFRDGLSLDLETRVGLVDAVGHRKLVAWVLAKHPMAKPESAFVDEVLAAFDELGSPLTPAEGAGEPRR